MLLHHSPGWSAATAARRVFIAIPVYGALAPQTAFALFQSHAVLNRAGYGVELGILCGNCHVDDARNLLVRDFLKSQCEDLLFIDADVAWRAEDLPKLLAHNRDVVAAVYPQKHDHETFPVRFLGDEIWSDAAGLIEVDGVPTGFLRIKRHVLEGLGAVSRRYRPLVSDREDAACAEIFLRDIVNGARMSGDLNFCRRWRALGGKVYVDPEIVLEHVGEKSWQGSLGSFLRRTNGLTLPRSMEAIKAGETPDIIELRAAWNNDAFTAGHELLASALQIARQARGPIIEAGSGLTSLVMAATGAEVHSLEHDERWCERMNQVADDLELDNLHVWHAPLGTWVHGVWYDDEDAELPWQACDIVVCDGPSRGISNRDSLFERMDKMGCRPRCILRDDVTGLEPPFSTWLAEHGYRAEIKGELRPFAVALK